MKPLAGRRIVVTRAQQQAAALSDELRALGAEVDEIPTIEIRPAQDYTPLDTALRSIAQYHWLILTSANGVKALFDRMREARIPVEELLRVRIAAIGPATRKAIESRGLRVEVVPDEYVAEAVVDSMRDVAKGLNVLLVRAKVARDVIPVELGKIAARVDVVEAYETVAPESSRQRLLEALQSDHRPDAITLTSSSTAKNLVEMLGDSRSLLNGVKLASIGPVTTATLKQLGFPPQIVASEYTIPGLVRAITESFAN